MRLADGGLIAAERAPREQVRLAAGWSRRGPAPGRRRDTSGEPDAGEPVAGTGRQRPGSAGVEGGRRGAVQAHPRPPGRAGNGAGRGPTARGWDDDQCSTLARITEVVRRRFRVDYPLAGMDVLLHRIGWSMQVRTRQAVERQTHQFG